MAAVAPEEPQVNLEQQAPKLTVDTESNELKTPSKLDTSVSSSSPGSPPKALVTDDENDNSQLDWVFSPRRKPGGGWSSTPPNGSKSSSRRNSGIYVSSIPAPPPGFYGPPSQRGSAFMSSVSMGRRGSVAAAQSGGKMLLHKLTNGGIFLKFGKLGNPHYRFVCVDKSLQQIEWYELDKRSKPRDVLKVKDLTKVEQGLSTDIFKKHQNSKTHKPDPEKCFSLITSSRTLDLECVSSDERAQWVIAFHFLMHYNPKRRNSIIGSGRSRPGSPGRSAQAQLLTTSAAHAHEEEEKEHLQIIVSPSEHKPSEHKAAPTSPSSQELEDLASPELLPSPPSDVRTLMESRMIHDEDDAAAEAAVLAANDAQQQGIPLEPAFGPGASEVVIPLVAELQHQNSSSYPPIIQAPDPEAVVVSWVEEVAELQEILAQNNREMKHLRQENAKLQKQLEQLSSQLKEVNIEPNLAVSMPASPAIVTKSLRTVDSSSSSSSSGSSTSS